MTSISAQDLTASRDCIVPGCPNEAEPGSERCRHHPEESLTGRVCKTDGCENAANTRYDRGIFAGLCVERCIPAKRAAASTNAVGAHERRQAASREEAIAALLADARGRGRFATTTEWQTLDPRPAISYNVVHRLFGGWRVALTAAGCPEGVWHQDVRVAPDGTITVPEGASATKPADDGRTRIDVDLPAAASEPEATRSALPAIDVPAAPDDPEHGTDLVEVEAPSLADIAERLQAAADDLERASEVFAAVSVEFAEHPLLQALVDEYGADWFRR